MGPTRPVEGTESERNPVPLSQPSLPQFGPAGGGNPGSSAHPAPAAPEPVLSPSKAPVPTQTLGKESW